MEETKEAIEGENFIAAAQTFDSILDALTQGSVVPFVGAGISMDARVPSNPPFEPQIGRRKYLWEQLRASMYRELCQSRARGNFRRVRLALSALGPIRKRSFGTMAEVHQWLLGSYELCETLKIRCFAQMEPTRAHYAVGCLVLEGLVDEVISTNWDTCIETGLGRLRGRAAGAGTEDTSHNVITNLGRYRQHGAKRRRKDGGAVLRLYKINGCAAEYTADPFKCAGSIVITERQLQDFGERSWARELLKDRVRSRTLLFSGFGSDEPQVRHTVLQLMDELSRDGRSDPAPAHQLFVVAHGAALSFSQQQILRAFSQAQGLDGQSIEDAIGARSLTGRDAPYFDLKAADMPSKRTLPADHFWCALFEAAMGWLIAERYTTPGFPLHNWLERHSPKPLAVRASLLDWLFPPNRAQKSAFRCALPGLFGPHPSKSGFILGRWLRVMRRLHVKTDKVPAYCALRDRREPLLPLATLTTLFLLARLTPSGSEIDKPARLDTLQERLDESFSDGLGVKHPAADRAARQGPSVVFLVTEAADESRSSAGVDRDTADRTRYEIAIPTSLAPHRDSRVMVELPGETRRIVQRCQIVAEDLLGADLSRGWGSLTRLFAERRDMPEARRKARLRREQENHVSA